MPDAINVIHLTREQIPIPGCQKFERLVLSSDAVFGPGIVVKQELYDKYNIPKVFDNRDSGILGQLAIVCDNGLHITSDFNVITLALYDLPCGPRGVTRAQTINNVVAQTSVTAQIVQ